ncbi:hypothetical protein F2Q70_00032315 [Brassica cretica]|uniref:Uncharacterized protein n=1 Tax=Brassica cretica TaxID=69181 RepID=A0A8S9FQJ9_BRACR|nr:hypothetical protein F2Q70_00032315 [Brassica cretica]
MSGPEVIADVVDEADVVVSAVHVDAWSSLTSQYHLGSPELSGGVRDNFVQCAWPLPLLFVLWADAKVDGADLVKLRDDGFGLSCLPRFRLDRVSV